MFCPKNLNFFSNKNCWYYLMFSQMFFHVPVVARVPTKTDPHLDIGEFHTSFRPLEWGYSWPCLALIRNLSKNVCLLFLCYGLSTQLHPHPESSPFIANLVARESMKIEVCYLTCEHSGANWVRVSRARLPLCSWWESLPCVTCIPHSRRGMVLSARSKALGQEGILTSRRIGHWLKGGRFLVYIKQ